MLGLINQPSVQYKQGTPFVPTDQVALLHKGEMVVPREHNPNANPNKYTSNEPTKDSSIAELVQVVKSGLEFIAKKMDAENTQTVVVEKEKPRSLKGAFYKTM